MVRLGRPTPVYNLTVGGTHTYFVRAGADDLWVHKAKKCGPLDINPDKQAPHVPGHKRYDPKRSTLTDPDPQGLLDGHSGTGQPLNSTPVPQPGSRERVDFGKEIGTYRNQSGLSATTTKDIIHYGGSGSHIIPSAP